MVTYVRLLLYPGEVFRFDGNCPVAIVCERGELWVTAGVEGVDHHLSFGQRLQCRKGRILIEGDGVLSIEQIDRKFTFLGWHGTQPFRNLRLFG